MTKDLPLDELKKFLFGITNVGVTQLPTEIVIRIIGTCTESLPPSSDRALMLRQLMVRLFLYLWDQGQSDVDDESMLANMIGQLNGVKRCFGEKDDLEWFGQVAWNVALEIKEKSRIRYELFHLAGKFMVADELAKVNCKIAEIACGIDLFRKDLGFGNELKSKLFGTIDELELFVPNSIMDVTKKRKVLCKLAVYKLKCYLLLDSSLVPALVGRLAENPLYDVSTLLLLAALIDSPPLRIRLLKAAASRFTPSLDLNDKFQVYVPLLEDLLDIRALQDLDEVTSHLKEELESVPDPVELPQDQVVSIVVSLWNGGVVQAMRGDECTAKKLKAAAKKLAEFAPKHRLHFKEAFTT